MAKTIRVLKCSKCGLPDAVWSFKTTAMQQKIYLCWTHLQQIEAQVAERGMTNIFNQ
jgi:hypothetical protein